MIRPPSLGKAVGGPAGQLPEIVAQRLGQMSVDQREAAAIDRLLQPGDQAATIRIATDVGQPLLAWLANLFLVNSAQSQPSVLT